MLNAVAMLSLHKKGKCDLIILADDCKNKTERAKSGVGVVTARVRFVRASVSETDSFYAQPRTLSAVFRREPILLFANNFLELSEIIMRLHCAVQGSFCKIRAFSMQKKRAPFGARVLITLVEHNLII